MEDFFTKKYQVNKKVLSSFFFTTNIMHLMLKRDEQYLYAWAELLATSIVYHTTENPYVETFDKTAIANVVSVGAMRMVEHQNFKDPLIIFAGLCAAICAYLYLFKTGCPVYGTYYHVLMHLFSSIGHHAVILTLKKEKFRSEQPNEETINILEYGNNILEFMSYFK